MSDTQAITDPAPAADQPAVADPAGTASGDDTTEPQDPFARFHAWFAEAEPSEPNDPNAMALATADAEGRPSVRMVLLKGVDRDGFVFYTNLDSRKGRALAANPVAELLFHWKSLQRQIRVFGPVARVSDAEADAYFATRPRATRIGAWASDQSRPMAGRFVLERRVAEMTVRFGFGEVPRPPHWGGFRLSPERIEFWRDRPFRLHERLVYHRIADHDDGVGAVGWRIERLFP